MGAIDGLVSRSGKIFHISKTFYVLKQKYG